MITIKLEPGQEIGLMAYKGSREEACKFQEIAHRYRNSNLPMPIDDCNVGILISKIDLIKVAVKEPCMSAYVVPPMYDREALNFKVEWAIMIIGEIS